MIYTDMRNFIFLMLHATFCIFLYIISTQLASNIFNMMAIGYLALTSLYILLDPRGGWIFLLYAFGLTLACLSNSLIELTNIFLIEIKEYPSLTGGAARNSFLSSFFLIVIYITYRFSLKFFPSSFPKVAILEPMAERGLLLLSVFVPCYLVACLIIYGSPLILGISRFDYFSSIAPSGFRRIYTFIPFLGLIVSLASYKGTINKIWSIVWIISLVFIMILTGEKFSLLFLSIFFFMLPVFIFSNKGVRLIHVFWGSAVLILLAGLIVLNYYIVSGSISMFLPRLALQGQMPYAVDGISKHMQELDVILKSFFGFGSPENENGIYFLMYLIAPSEIVDRMLSAGITFTVPFPSNFSYFFGYTFAPVFLTIHGILAGVICGLFYKAIQQKNFILTSILAITFHLVYLATIMGKIDRVFGWPMAMCILFLIFYMLVSLAFKKKF